MSAGAVTPEELTEKAEPILAEDAPVPEQEKLPEEQAEEDDGPQLLNLAALTPTRRMVKLPTSDNPRGETYEMRLVDDFGIENQQQLVAWGKEFQKLMNSDTVLKENQRERLRFLLDTLFSTIIDAPDAVKKNVSDTIKNKVIQTFTWAPVLAQQELQSQVITQLIDKGDLTQEQVDEVLEEIREQIAARQISGS